MTDLIQGTRVEYCGQLLKPGEYVVGEPWHACTPNGVMANLSNHQKHVHPDGTLSVSPSVECGQGIIVLPDGKHRIDPNVAPYWHGYLLHGRWRTLRADPPEPPPE